MHAIVFVPAAVFAAVAGLCWGIMMLIERRESRRRPAAALPAPPAVPVRRAFRPVVIAGGLAAMSYRRSGKTALASIRVAGVNDNAVRAFGG